MTLKCSVWLSISGLISAGCDSNDINAFVTSGFDIHPDHADLFPYIKPNIVLLPVRTCNINMAFSLLFSEFSIAWPAIR